MISKINSEVRGGKSPRIKRLSEYIGQSYFEYLAGLHDLVLIMDESHRYRASAGVRAINELNPVLGLELTATPFIETSRGAVAFKNVIIDYPLGRAMDDGFVKEPAVVTRKNFNPSGMAPEEIERLKLEDGVRLHESVKVDLETYARESGNIIVKPFLLVIARDTTHAGQLLQLIQSDGFFEGRYKEKVIQVDSSKTGAEEEEMIERLLKVEHTDEPTEIVIHVNMLKEGWDVTNLYTIVPLRAANARILIEQSIGRGLRLPYDGRRTGVAAVDRLNIVAHDKFQEIIDEANRPDSTIRLQAVIIDDDQLGHKTVTVVSQSTLATRLGMKPDQIKSSTTVAGQTEIPLFRKPEEQKVAQIAYDVIRKLELSENIKQELKTIWQKTHDVWQLAYDHNRRQLLWQRNTVRVFYSGGGSNLPFVRDIFGQSWMHDQGWGPYPIEPLPVPDDYRMNEAQAPFQRMAVAYGLSIPRERMKDFALPSQSPDHTTRLPEREEEYVKPIPLGRFYLTR